MRSVAKASAEPSVRVHRVGTFEDPRVRGFAQIRERDLVGRDGRFIAEGEVVLRVLLDTNPRAIDSIAITERREARVLPLVEGHDLDIFVLPDSEMEKLTGIDLHRGILALARRFEAESPSAALSGSGPAIALGLFGLSNHDNVGGIFRNAAAFGVRAALLDDASCDPFYRKAIRVSVGGVFKTPFYRGGTDLAHVAAFRDAGFECVALSPNGDEELADAPFAARTALLLGAEGSGLSDAVLRQTRTIRIAMAPGFDSLNVAATSAVALHALFTRARARLVQGG